MDIDPKRILIHEAGHGLVWSAEVPTPSSLIIFSHPEKRGHAFAATMRERRPVEKLTPARLWFEMVVQLGGPVAEQVVWGDSSQLSSHDYQQWSERAREFGKRFPGVGWTEEAINDTQTKGLIAFFTINRHILQQMADQLERDRLVNVAEFLIAAEPVDYLKPSIIPRLRPNE